jgi:hypothetical protein
LRSESIPSSRDLRNNLYTRLDSRYRRDVTHTRNERRCGAFGEMIVLARRRPCPWSSNYSRDNLPSVVWWAALRELATPQSAFGRIARGLRRMHLDCAQALDVNSLAREAGMSQSTSHANFKAVTAKPRLRYLQIVRLQKSAGADGRGYTRGRGPTCP